MPKVIHVVRKFEPEAWGGVETHLVEVIPALAELGWRSEVHAPRERATDGAPLEAVGATFRTFRARYPYLGLDAERRAALVACGGNLVSVEELARLVLAERADVLHAHTLGRLGGVVRLASKLTGVPYAVTLHGPVRANADAVAQASEERTKHLVDVGQAFGWMVGARRVVEDADLVFALHEGERAAWAKARAGRHLERAIHGVSASRATDEARRAARARIPGLGDARLVLVLGRMEPAKGQDLALDAFTALGETDAHVAFIGAAASPAFAADLTARAASNPRVHVLPGVAPAEARALLGAADLVVIPSRAEPFGIVLLEAWAEGARVLHADVDGLASIARELGATASAVAPNDVAALARAMRAALDDPAPLAREGARLRAEVAKKFSWSSVAAGLADRYAQVSVSRRRSAS